MTVESTESVDGDARDLAERGEEGIDVNEGLAERAVRDRACNDCGGGLAAPVVCDGGQCWLVSRFFLWA